MLRLVAVNGLCLLAMQYSGFAVTTTGWMLASLYTAASLSWVIVLKTNYKTIASEA
jgi:hypothetical protein